MGILSALFYILACPLTANLKVLATVIAMYRNDTITNTYFSC